MATSQSVEQAPEPGLVRLSNPSGQVLGSGVLVAPRWVLTVSHVLASPQRALRVELSGSQRSAGVLGLHWCRGSEESAYVLNSGEAWPALGRGEHDHPVLLELDSEFTGVACANPASATEVAGGSVEFRGLGIDSEGNYSDQPLRCRLDDLGLVDGHPALARIRLEPGKPGPEADHSGGGVFSSGPGGALLGLHSHRRSAGSETHAVFSALDERSRDWILRKRLPGPALSLATRSRPLKLTLRGQHNVFGVNRGDVSFGPTLTLGDCCSALGLLRPGTVFQVSQNEKDVLKLDGSHADGTRLSARLEPRSLLSDGHVHCWSGVFESSNAQHPLGELYLFVRGLGANGRVLMVRMELFVKGSNHRPADHRNLEEEHRGSNPCPRPRGRWASLDQEASPPGTDSTPPRGAPASSSAAVALTMDQDEEGEGYDDLAH